MSDAMKIVRAAFEKLHPKASIQNVTGYKVYGDDLEKDFAVQRARPASSRSPISRSANHSTIVSSCRAGF